MLAFTLLTVWVAWLAGNGTHAIIDQHQNASVYRIGVDYAGHTTSQCDEK